MGLAVPGFLLSGWAPARALARPVQVTVSEGPNVGETMRRGVAFGMSEVQRAAQLTGVPVLFERTDARPAASSTGTGRVELAVCAADDGRDGPTHASASRIYTCPLREWRRDAWSVASRPADVPRFAAAPTLDWHFSLTRGGAAQLNERFFQHAGVPMDEAAWRGWMAVKIAYETGLRAQAGEDDVLALEFEGHKGRPLRFAEDGHLLQPTYRLGANARAVEVSPAADDDVHVS